MSSSLSRWKTVFLLRGGREPRLVKVPGPRSSEKLPEERERRWAGARVAVAAGDEEVATSEGPA